jgi:hypothetical protein
MQPKTSGSKNMFLRKELLQNTKVEAIGYEKTISYNWNNAILDSSGIKWLFSTKVIIRSIKNQTTNQPSTESLQTILVKAETIGSMYYELTIITNMSVGGTQTTTIKVW